MTDIPLFLKFSNYCNETLTILCNVILRVIHPQTTLKSFKKEKHFQEFEFPLANATLETDG